MGSCFQYHVTMLISGEQEEAIRFMFKEKKWPCLLSVLSKETVTDIVQSGFTDVFPFPAESEEPGGVGSFREIKSEVVNIETEDILTKEYQATSVKREAPRSSDEEDDDLYDDSTDENDESDEDQNESASSTNMPSETTTRKRSSKAKKLKMDKGARVYKNMQRRVKCPLCDVELASKSILKRHCLRRHPDEWFEFKCADCPSMFKTQCDHVIAVCQNDQTVDQAQGFKRFRPAAGTSAEPELSESENYVCEVTTSNSTDRPVNTSCEVRSKFTNMPVSTSCEVRSESTNKPVSTSCEARSKSTNIPVNTSCEVRSESTNKPVSTSSEVKSKSTNRLSNKGNEGRSKSMHWTVNLGCEVATYKSTNWAVNTLNEWITEMRYDADGFEEWPADKLDSMLEEFYSSLRTKKGEEYSGSSLAGIRAGLNRYLTQPPHNRSLCLMRDKEFVKSNLIIYKLKSVQKDDVEHREPISDEDLIKLYESGAFSLEKPRTLQNKVQFEIMMNFDIHGKEGLRSLKKTDFKLETDPNGCLFISLNESNKIHTSAGRDVNKKQCMYEQPGDKHCPVTSFMKYLSKLNPACDALFQRPKVVDIEDSIWYGEMPVGLNTLAKLMSRLSERAELSVRYTNQCIRATFFKILQRVKVSGLGVYAITRQNNAYGVRAHEQSTEITQMPVLPVCLAPDSTKRNSNVEEDVKNSALTEPEEELWKHRDEVKHEPPKKTPKQFEKSNHTPEELRDMGHVQCNACAKFFHNDRMLRKHLYYAHRDLMPVPICAVCDTQFKTRQELWKHKKETSHNDCVSLLKHYQCDSCGKILKGGYYSFVHHQKLACGKEEKELEELKVLPCDICGSTFKTKHQIQCHKKAVHLDAPEVCDVCGNVYKNQLALRAHKKRHDEKNRKYACNDCERSFFNSTLLKQHIRTHTKEKPFKCPMCNYTSACKENIGKHTLSVHKVKAKALDLRKQKFSDTVTAPGNDVMDLGSKDDDANNEQQFMFHSSVAEKNDELNSSKLMTASEISTSSYVELMNCDVNPHTYVHSNIDQVQYPYPWGNPARR